MHVLRRGNVSACQARNILAPVRCQAWQVLKITLQRQLFRRYAGGR